MQQATVDRALAQYGLSARSDKPVQKGYRNESYAVTLRDGKVVNLLFYKAEPDILPKIKAANFASEHAAHKGLPTRTLCDPRILKLQTGNYTSYACLYEYLPGSTIPWEAYTMNHIKLVGKALARLHVALADTNQSAPSITNTCLSLCSAMQEYFGLAGVQRAMQEKLNTRFENNALTMLPKLVPNTHTNHQLLHMDFVRGNLLFRPSKASSDLTEGSVELCGIIDFEKVSIGSPIFDIARTLAFLLVDCKYKTKQQVYKYFLQSGYYKRGGGTTVDSQKLDQLTSFYLVHDFYKFLKHNPYESLRQNEHYIRTRDILIERKLLELA